MSNPKTARMEWPHFPSTATIWLRLRVESRLRGKLFSDTPINYINMDLNMLCVRICLLVYQRTVQPCCGLDLIYELLHCDCGNGPRMQRDVSFSIFSCLCYLIVSVINSKANKSERLLLLQPAACVFLSIILIVLSQPKKSWTQTLRLWHPKTPNNTTAYRKVIRRATIWKMWKNK